ncbi:PREDICTED: uncharacterized protein LOC104607004 [Nelumbo nucifera]|uniref:Oxidative stress 3 n=2 Tax=Nelumbo nucifera TaxID=4432 RepID=A0A822YJ21_NELNU|nr:PREDICTED: uncharacterized protein LOC104607004 [Nelumbo nucifera]DAD32580.1 TPA_asm: hypothetical protein HUJ06_011431 [Nelumbo nucifera]
MDSSFRSSKNQRIVDEEDDDLGSLSSSSDISCNSSSSSVSDFLDDATSSTTSSSPPGSSSSSEQLAEGPLYEMSPLMKELPFKRGLSKHFQGKSQSFTSLSDVKCLEDLAKPENPYKKMKSCKSYASLSACSPKTWTKPISKKASRGSCSSLSARRSNSFLGNSRPPIPPQRVNSLFA